MTQSFSAAIECDRCHEIEEFDIETASFSDIETQLWTQAETAGWTVGTEDLCQECQAKKDR